MIKKYSYQRELKQNPYTGFTSFQHFGNDKLYSDLIVRPENNMTETEHIECYPIPSYVEENGRKQGYYPDCTICYIRVLWKEFEPEQGRFNYDFIQSILDKARAQNQVVMFRLMPHSTRETDDVPDWIKSIIDCPKRPAGMRIKTSPSDPRFLDFFANAIRHLGEHFDNNPTLKFVDTAIAGAWGEGSSIFSDEQQLKVADVYTEVFKNTMLIGQCSHTVLMKHLLESGDVGWRADGVGEACQTKEGLPKYVAEIPDAWKKGHVTFESYWWLGEWMRKGWDIDAIIEVTLAWHVSSFNAKSLPIPFEWKEKIDAWVSKMGYHYVIDEISHADEAKCGEKLSIKLCVDNIGVAPAYFALPLYVRLKNPNHEFQFKTDVDITKWIEGKHTQNILIALPADMPSGEYSVQVAIGGEGAPIVYFATDAEFDGRYYALSEIKIV